MHIFGTSIFVEGEVDPQELYSTLLRQIIFYDGRPITTTDIPLVVGTDEGINHYLIDVHGDHGLQVLAGVWYKDNGESLTGEEAKGVWHTSCADSSCTTHQVESCRVLAGFATSLHYSDERGWNAGNLHSGMIYALGGFLDTQKVPWKWQEGFRKEIHEGYGDLDQLPKLVQQIHSALANPGQLMAQHLLRMLGLIQGNDS